MRSMDSTGDEGVCLCGTSVKNVGDNNNNNEEHNTVREDEKENGAVKESQDKALLGTLTEA